MGDENLTPQWPDLQQLVQQHGGYAAIPSEAWARFDKAVNDWRRWYAECIRFDSKVWPR